MKKTALYVIALLTVLTTMSSCSDTMIGDTDDSYTNWQARNTAYFKDSIIAQAHDSIAYAKAKYGEKWQDSCNWRIYRSLFKSQSDASLSSIDDSIVVHIHPSHLHGGNVYGGTESPAYNDSVRISYRGYLMPLNYGRTDQSSDKTQEQFTTSYYGKDSEITANTTAPILTCPNTFVDGFSTALQYMKPGDVWTIYVPSALAYGSSSSGIVKAYSTLEFLVYLYDWYESADDAPDWYARKR